MAETSGLLNRRTGDSRTEGSNPSVSASQAKTIVKFQCVGGNRGRKSHNFVPQRRGALVGCSATLRNIGQADSGRKLIIDMKEHRVPHPGIDGRLAPAGAARADAHLRGERAVLDLAIKS